MLFMLDLYFVSNCTRVKTKRVRSIHSFLVLLNNLLKDKNTNGEMLTEINNMAIKLKLVMLTKDLNSVRKINNLISFKSRKKAKTYLSLSHDI
jgi:hypothetical protein